MSENNLGKSLFWKLMERFGVSIIQFILQIILARILEPEKYGALGIMIIFISIANVLVQNGFNTALIQNKDVKEEDYSTVFWLSLMISAVLYAVIFAIAPIIGQFFSMPEIVFPLRILAIVIFPGALNSVQLAKISRQMNFKKVFFSNLGGVIISGIVGIVIAVSGGGLWALVAQSLLNVTVATIVMCFSVDLKIYFICNLKRAKILISYGWKLLVSSLIDTLYHDLCSLVYGKKYDSEILGFFNRGKQFPQFIINAVNGAVQSVMLPAISVKQDDKESVKKLTRNSIMLSTYIIFPMMAILASIASPLVNLLLKDVWMPCVPYLQIYCFIFAFYPVHTCNLQAINAIGRSDIFLKLEIIKKFIGVISLIIAIFYFDSPIAIAMTGVFTTFTSTFINAYPNKKLINYSYLEQIKDILPSLLLSIIMCMMTWVITLFGLFAIITILSQVVIGFAFYILMSILFKMKPFYVLKDICKNYLKTH